MLDLESACQSNHLAFTCLAVVRTATLFINGLCCEGLNECRIQQCTQSSQPQFTAKSVMQVKSESWVQFPGSSFALKEYNAKPHLSSDGSTWPFFCFWVAGDGDSQCMVRRSLLLKVVPVPIHFAGN